MQIVRAAEIDLIPAGHENTLDPGCLKKIMVHKADISAGRLQMINWVILKPARSFSAHYHEKMTEIFIILSGRAEIRAQDKDDLLHEGDAAVIPPRSVHTMTALDGRAVHYLAIGIVHGPGGRTVVI